MKRETSVTFFLSQNLSSLEKDLGSSEVSRTGGVVEISCLEVIRELSSYFDRDVTPELREQIVAHLPGCLHCTAVYDGLRNTITLIGDGRSLDLR